MGSCEGMAHWAGPPFRPKALRGLAGRAAWTAVASSEMAVFAVPALMILPLKIGAIAMMAHGHLIVGVLILLGAKILALGVTAFLFEHCRRRILQMPRFAKFYSLVLQARAWASALVAPARAQLHALSQGHPAKGGCNFKRQPLEILPQIDLVARADPASCARDRASSADRIAVTKTRGIFVGGRPNARGRHETFDQQDRCNDDEGSKAMHARHYVSPSRPGSGHA